MTNLYIRENTLTIALGVAENFQMKLRFHLGNNIMKIKFKNENYLEPIKSTDIKRSYRVDKLKEFYLKYPDVFLENYFDIELLEYQKFFIRLIVRDKK